MNSIIIVLLLASNILVIIQIDCGYSEQYLQWKITPLFYTTVHHKTFKVYWELS